MRRGRCRTPCRSRGCPSGRRSPHGGGRRRSRRRRRWRRSAGSARPRRRGTWRIRGRCGRGARTRPPTRANSLSQNGSFGSGAPFSSSCRVSSMCRRSRGRRRHGRRAGCGSRRGRSSKLRGQDDVVAAARGSVAWIPATAGTNPSARTRRSRVTAAIAVLAAASVLVTSARPARAERVCCSSPAMRRGSYPAIMNLRPGWLRPRVRRRGGRRRTTACAARRWPRAPRVVPLRARMCRCRLVGRTRCRRRRGGAATSMASRQSGARGHGDGPLAGDMQRLDRTTWVPRSLVCVGSHSRG